jgi:uncharacterized damage-inducible protein DinB
VSDKNNINMVYFPKPTSGFIPFYAGYMSLVPDDGDLPAHLAAILAETETLVEILPPDKLTYRYAEGKWTLKDILVHLMDAERVFVYRAMRFARNDATDLPGFDENVFVENAGANDREITSIMAEFAAQRAATIAFLTSLDTTAWQRQGTANGGTNSVASFLSLTYGHHRHHLNVFRERYLNK